VSFFSFRRDQGAEATLSPLGTKIGFQWMAVTMSLVGIVTFLPVVYFMFHGKMIRDKMGAPSYNRSL
jgi:hypothetical protein